MWTDEERKAYHKNRRAMLISMRRCVNCTEKLPEGDNHQQCESCRKKTKVKQKQAREALKTMGRCIRCRKKKPEDGHVLCEDCRSEHRAAYADRISVELCANCGRELDDPHYVKCSRCRSSAAESQRRYVEGLNDGAGI